MYKAFIHRKQGKSEGMDRKGGEKHKKERNVLLPHKFKLRHRVLFANCTKFQALEVLVLYFQFAPSEIIIMA
jgi:hypothetical protein